jgi:hypothetical protein
VFARNKNETDLQFMINALELQRELIKMVFRERVLPKKYRNTLGVSIITTAQELVDNLVLLYDYNIFNSKIKDFEDIEVGNDCMHKSEIDLMYGNLNVIPDETLDVIIREYDKRSKHKTTGNARLGRIANNIYNSLKENNGYRTATYVKQYSFIYDLFVLYGKVSDSCGKGFRGGIGREKYQNVKNWITAYKTFVQRNKQDS